MKITTFNPLIVTKDAENVIKLFEALGFERRHSLDANTGNVDYTNVTVMDDVYGGVIADALTVAVTGAEASP